MEIFNYSLPEEIWDAVNLEIADWNAKNKIARIWNKDASVWTNADEADWLGWLDIADHELNDLEKYDELRGDIESGKFKDVLLMGMGGSSLCPDVLAKTFGKTRFHILDSTVPAQVLSVEKKLDLANTLFIVASKSGSTLEPNCFKQYFFERVAERVGQENAGRQFVAVTDPGSKMEKAAKDDGFRYIFYGKPEVGGRFSALSAFGMTAAASMLLDQGKLLRNAVEMSEQCRNEDAAKNPGALLGIILGICHRAGRDKLTIFASPEVADLGAWLEQLIAESTGKHGVSIIPVDGEAPLPADKYGADRVFAFINFSASKDLETALFAQDIANAGQPVVTVSIDDLHQLGREFFRWEFATAVAGSIMGINPFDQPDVESAKIEARKLTDEFEKTGKLPEDSPFLVGDTVKLFANAANIARLDQGLETKDVSGYLRSFASMTEPGDYLAILAYVEMDLDNQAVLAAIRKKLSDKTGVATCLGFGPRFLHSTGQAYKGGENNGVFLQITSDDAVDADVPGQSYSFGVVKAAQAAGDLQVLFDRERRALRVHLGEDVKKGLEKLLVLL